jgi:hypothetical protein
MSESGAMFQNPDAFAGSTTLFITISDQIKNDPIFFYWERISFEKIECHIVLRVEVKVSKNYNIKK